MIHLTVIAVLAFAADLALKSAHPTWAAPSWRGPSHPPPLPCSPLSRCLALYTSTAPPRPVTPLASRNTHSRPAPGSPRTRQKGSRQQEKGLWGGG
jgi:hypothetical protein